MNRRHRAQTRGFALLFIVMVVAVVAVAAAALLDIVEVDLLIANEQRRTATAEAIAEGAIKEMQADRNTLSLLPTSQSPNLLVQYAAPDGSGSFVKDPGGLVVGPTPLDESNSAYVRFNTPAEATERQGYTADIRLLRTGPIPKSGMNTTQAVIYELRARSQIGINRATSEARAEAYIYASGQNGTVGQIHGR